MKLFDEINVDNTNDLNLLEHISYTTHFDESSFYSDIDDFKKSFSDSVVVLGEKFWSANEMSNSGSSRHLFVQGADIKGAGRNLLAHRADYSHSWGGLNLNDVILDYFYGNLLHFSTPLGAERIFAITKIDKGYLAFRERGSHRICNSSVDFRFPRSQKHFSLLVSNYPSPKEFVQAHIIQLTSSLLNGFYHGALTLENSLISGRFIDNQTFLPTEDINTLEFELMYNERKQTSTEDYYDFNRFIESVNADKKNFFVSLNNCINYLQIIDYVQISLEKNANYEKSDSFDLWKECLRSKFNFEEKNIDAFTRVFDFIKDEEYLSSSREWKELQDNLISVKHSYDHKTLGHVIKISIKMKENNSPLDAFKKNQLSKRKKGFQLIQKFFISNLKNKAPITEFSEKLLSKINDLAIPSHFLINKGTTYKNEFTTIEELERYLSNHYGYDSNMPLKVRTLNEERPSSKILIEIKEKCIISALYKDNIILNIPAIYYCIDHTCVED